MEGKETGARPRINLPHGKREWRRLLFSIAMGVLAMLALTVDLQEVYDSRAMPIVKQVSYAVLHGSLQPTLVSVLLAALFHMLRRTLGAFWKDASCVALSALLTAMTMIAIGFHNNGNFDLLFGAPLNAAAALLMCAGFFFLFGHLFRLLQAGLDACVSPAGEGKSVRWMTAALLLCWLPYLLIGFPGAVHTDSMDQIWQVMGTLYPGEVASRTANVSQLSSGTMLINDMQPVLHTLIVGYAYAFFWKLGCSNLAVLLLVCLQAFLMAWTMARSIDFLRRVQIRRGVLRGCFLFFAFYPSFPAYAFTVLKDSTFGLAFFAVLLFLLELITFPKATLRGKRRMLGGAVAVFFFLQLRGFSLALLLLALLFMLPSLLCRLKAHKISRVRVICVFLAPIALSVGLNQMVYPLCGVGKGPARESLSFFFMQTALVAREHGDAIPEEEKAAINRVLRYDEIGEAYNMRSADDVKRTAVLTATSEDYKAYFKAYLAQLKRYPLTCLRAMICMNDLYFDVYYAHAEYGLFVYMGPPETNYWFPYVGVDYLPVLAKLAWYVKNGVRAFAMLPIVSVFFNIGTYTVLLLCAAANLIRRRRRGLCAIAAPLAYAACLIFAPVNGSTRYAFVLYLVAPLALFYSCGEIKRKLPFRKRRDGAAL